jgi:hypothetical protein
MFLLIFGVSAWLCRTRAQAALWAVGFLALIPCYWLGWVYAPFALLLAPTAFGLVARFGIAAVLGLIHLAFWQGYSGDYIGLMVWLKGTLGVRAGEHELLVLLDARWRPESRALDAQQETLHRCVACAAPALLVCPA